MINRPSLDQPLYLDISRYLDILHLDTGYLNISISIIFFRLYSLRKVDVTNMVTGGQHSLGLEKEKILRYADI